MNNNNINKLTFDNHDTYIYYVDELTKNLQQVQLTPTNSNNTDIIRYISGEASLFTNGIINGNVKFNSFNNFSNNFGSLIGTIITNNGILMFNYAADRNSSGLTNNQQIKSLATYKSDNYANYINVEILIDFEDTYRIVTVSY